MDEALERLRHELADGVSGLSAEGTQARPSAERWSIQQVMEHLVLSYGATSAVFETRLAKGTPTKAKPTPAQWVGQLAVTGLGIFPKGRKSPAAVAPASDTMRRLSGEELQEQAALALGRMDGLLVRAETMFGSSRGVSHLVLGPMSVRQWRRFHLVHGRHHLKQIAAIRAAHRGN